MRQSYFKNAALLTGSDVVLRLKQDLALTPKDMKVILCYHIPFTFGNAPFSKNSHLRFCQFI